MSVKNRIENGVRIIKGKALKRKVFDGIKKKKSIKFKWIKKKISSNFSNNCNLITK